MKDKLVHLGIISIFVSLYFLVATISMINSVAFFDLSHSGLMSWSLAIGFELGAAASLAAIIILDKTNKTMVWGLFLLLTAFQMMANSYHAFVNLEDYMGWIELFGLEEEEPIFQKRILSVVSGAVLPLVALGFIKSLTDYIRPEETVTEEEVFTELDRKETSENTAEEINDQPKEVIEKVIEESSNISKETEDDVILNTPTAEKKTELETQRLSRISKTKVRHVEKVLKNPNESLDTKLNNSTAIKKKYIPKP
jgi:uncharacterized protein (DUF1778 family)